jgi:SAM-dependent methyltransferase
VDVVSAASAAHWFPLVDSKREILRILRPGGVFAHFYYYAIPLTRSWDLDQVCRRLLDEYASQAQRNGFAVPTPKPEVQRAFVGGGFDRDRLFYMQAEYEWDAVEYMRYIMTWGRLAEMVAADVDPLCSLVHEVSEVAFRDLGSSPSRCTFSYPVNVLRKAP